MNKWRPVQLSHPFVSTLHKNVVAQGDIYETRQRLAVSQCSFE